MAQSGKRVAFITGGTQGIGAATATLLVNKGWFVALNYFHNDSAASSFVTSLGGPSHALALKGDAGCISDISTMISTIISQCGRLDAVIANAAAFELRDLAATTEADFDALMRLNVKGPYFLAQKAAPYLPPGSHILFLSTSQCHASTVTPAYLLYNTTKGAVEQMTRVLAKDLGRRGIFVNAVAPGPTATELFMKGKDQQVLETIKGWNPQGRIGTPDEVAEVLAFLVESRWVSGQVVRVNGGMV